MFQYIYQWMIQATFYMVVFTAVMQLLPNGDYQKYVKFFTGLIMILLILTPAMKLLGMERDFMRLYQDYKEEHAFFIEEKSEFEERQIYVEPVEIQTEITRER